MPCCNSSAREPNSSKLRVLDTRCADTEQITLHIFPLIYSHSDTQYISWWHYSLYYNACLIYTVGIFQFNSTNQYSKISRKYMANIWNMVLNR